MKATIDVGKFMVRFNKKLEKHKMGREAGLKQVALAITSQVILATPVMTGRARGNWFSSIDEPANTVDDAARQTEAKGVSNDRAQSVVKANEISGHVFWMTNNLPYIGLLEFGGYPTYVKRGTWMGAGKGYEIRSSAGFSKQAPTGMVRVTLEAFKGTGVITRIIREGIDKEMRDG